MSFSLNGAPVTVGEHPHLLAALREELDVTSPKDGCSPSGQCGCCTVLVGGKPMVSCSLALERVAGRDVITLEGLDAAERDRYAAEKLRLAGLHATTGEYTEAKEPWFDLAWPAAAEWAESTGWRPAVGNG